MATNTTNYNFKKPDESDFYSIQDQNGNWDKADAALKDVDTPTFEDYSGSMTVPDAATAINSIRSKGKLSTILSNMKAAFKGACLIGQIVNNCVTNNAKLPLSAAQGKALMDLYTQLNSDLGVNLSYYTCGIDAQNGATIADGYAKRKGDICMIFIGGVTCTPYTVIGRVRESVVKSDIWFDIDDQIKLNGRDIVVKNVSAIDAKIITIIDTQ